MNVRTVTLPAVATVAFVAMALAAATPRRSSIAAILRAAASRLVPLIVPVLLMLAVPPSAVARERAWPRGAARGAAALRWADPGEMPGEPSAMSFAPFGPQQGLPSLPGRAPTVRVGANPVGEVVDPRTHTLYVANGNDNTVSVINTATCNALRAWGCSQSAPAVATGPGPLALALDRATNTLYVSNLNGGAVGTISMIDAATCNATDHAGCDQVAPQVTVGPGPALLAIDYRTNTVYIPESSGDTVSMLDAATCNAHDINGCSVSNVTAGSGPSAVAVNPRTHTAYVPNFNDGTVSVIDTATCNATSSGGCSSPLPAIALGASAMPDAVVVDQPSDTVYVPTFGPSLGALALINGATCNASARFGCSQTPRTTPIGGAPIWIVENPATRTVYAENQEDSSISVIDAATCNAIDTTGCRRVPPALATGFDAGGEALDPSTDTVYATSQNNGTVTVLNGGTCNAVITLGCSDYAPTIPVGNGPQPIAVDPSTGTVYVGSQYDDTVSVVNAVVCNVEHPSGCDRAWPTIGVGFAVFFGLALDPATHSLYVSNVNGNTVAVINTATCNAMTQAGCGQTPETIAVGNAPAGIAIDQATDTVYVANIGDNTVSVIDGATCNAIVHGGCGQTPPTIATGNAPLPIGLNQATGTLYIGNQGDDTVSVIDAATCNAVVHMGCGQTAPTVAIADAPFGLAVDQQNDTVYVANTGVEEFQTGYANLTSSVSVINGAGCNATTFASCANTPASVPVGGFPWDVAVDPVSQMVYVTSIVDSDVATFDAATCNGASTANCRTTILPELTGGWPEDLGIDSGADTLYVTNNTSGDLSILPLRAP
jgi:YVTN family beta-propeller protein